MKILIEDILKARDDLKNYIKHPQQVPKPIPIPHHIRWDAAPVSAIDMNLRTFTVEYDEETEQMVLNIPDNQLTDYSPTKTATSQAEWERQYKCTFEPDMRITHLTAMYMEYYKKIAHMSSSEAQQLNCDIKMWTQDRGFSHEEKADAKKQALRNLNK
jgi:hypothetical protein